MIWILTTIIALLILWSIYSIWVMESNFDKPFSSLYPCKDFDDVICNISIIYWSAIIIIILGSILMVVSWFISSAIMCGTSNGDGKYCEMFIKKE